jgi:hypothetical protein
MCVVKTQAAPAATGRRLAATPGIARSPNATRIPIVEQNHFPEVNADLLGQPLKLFDELRPAKVLRNDHVMTRA